MKPSESAFVLAALSIICSNTVPQGPGSVHSGILLIVATMWGVVALFRTIDEKSKINDKPKG